MPEAVKGQVLPMPDGDYVVLVNARYNFEQQKEAFNHEMRHLLYEHYYDARPIAALEAEANAKDALLDRIKDAEANGLPLSTVLFKKTDETPRRKTENDRIIQREKRAALTGAWY